MSDDAFKCHCPGLGYYSVMQAATPRLLSLLIYYLAFINYIIILLNYKKITFFYQIQGVVVRVVSFVLRCGTCVGAKYM